MKMITKTAFAACALVLGSQAMAQVVLYEGEGFRGRSVVVDKDMRNLDRRGLGNKASSIVVERGRWEVCPQPRFEGRCAVLRKGNYPTLRGTGLDENISSIRKASEGRRYDNEPQAAAGEDYKFRRRGGERTSEVPVTSVRAIMGPPNQRCWVDRQAAPAPVDPAAALIAGVLGYQVGPPPQTIQRCTTVQGRPDHYEVTYNFRGSPRTVQMAAPPATDRVVVNERGEPRM
ncbi:beta/gamma crystallin family protein [Caenimonas aquaedulcis]|uniref:Beta/gamma crystallin family protein n=1 Tax=Caenimonas aquaedulcis TaxID=2793270 RepID=A0A931H919_9BURK|nr:beta/gamma crystallin family protein [Caenimonas aquaedulcis]MBG9390555.1 beta/gamma crystallin family protein [Caenimonas aquaedulcis]